MGEVTNLMEKIKNDTRPSFVVILFFLSSLAVLGVALMRFLTFYS